LIPPMPGKKICRASGSGRKGVSTVVGMTIFLLLFAIAVAYVFMWSQNSGIYIDTVKKQVDFERSRLTENLIVTAKNLTTVLVENPTAGVIVVTQVWSNNNMTWGPGEIGVSPFGTVEIVGNTGWVGDGNFTVVTYRGNIFSGGIKTQMELSTRRSWEVTWYWNGSMTTVQHNAMRWGELALNQRVGTTYWYDLNIDYEWDYLNNPVIERVYNMSDSTMLGFVAKTTLIKLSDDASSAWINYYISDTSRVAIIVDGSGFLTWATEPVEITGEQYSLHEVEVYFDGYGRGDAALRLNIVNATFAR
jgi:hypothetical protein